MPLSPGSRLGPYEILSPLGAGGMGEVYRARDTRLDRPVAVKVLPEEFFEDKDRVARFEREAKSLATLNHPGIAAVYSFEEISGRRVIAMELVEGEDLAQKLLSGPLSLDECLALARQIAGALEAAHEKGIVHRDLKPANVRVTADGRVKLLDFGIAKRSDAPVGAEDETATGPLTQQGVVMGTVPYMSPEQIEGGAVGPASDVFSLGTVLYELVTDRRPFRGASPAALMSSILRETPAPPLTIRKDLPAEVDALIVRCLAKDPAQRPSAAAVRDGLSRLAQKENEPARPVLARPGVLVAVGLTLAAVIAVSWTAVSRSRKAAFVAQALPRIERLAREAQYVPAFELAREVERNAGAGAVPDSLWDLACFRVSVSSNPEGASVTIRRFDRADEARTLGVTPLTRIRVPRGPMHWRVEAAGHRAADLVTAQLEESLRFELRRDDGSDPDMVLVPGGDAGLWALGSVQAEMSVPLGRFLIDRHEVTNRDFARFVAARGYGRQEYWSQEFRDGAHWLSFREAMDRFRDSTGRSGPAPWKLGSSPDGQEDLPVTGVSWYEAAAYARFAGKELPTIYHWYFADTDGDLQLLPALVLPLANLDGKGLRAGKESRALGAHGVYDMAGNAREWSASESDRGTRIALGGAFSDPSYIYLTPEIRSPFDRADGNGFRCIKRLDESPLPEAATRPLPSGIQPDYSRQRPVSDEVYAAFARLFEHRPVALEPRIEATDESSQHWVKQRISYAAGYGHERMTALLYLPRSARPPYQIVVQMGGASTFGSTLSSATESEIFGWRPYAEYLIRAGRAVLLPIWKGSYERSDGFGVFTATTGEYREHVVDWVAEMHQSVDYLQSRGDVDPGKIAYQGISLGSTWAPHFLALEPRLKAGILIEGGVPVMQSRARPYPPELQLLNFAPRVKVPVLMLNGRQDAIFPYETSQLPLFRAFGSLEALKRHATFPGGHDTFGWRDELYRESLDWLDRHLGPVTSR